MPIRGCQPQLIRSVWKRETKGRAAIRWDNVVEKVWNIIGGNQDDIFPNRKFVGYKTETEGKVEISEKLTSRNKLNGGLREEISLKRYLHGPVYYAKTPKLPFTS